ncbi:MAG: hydrogen peroxide-inducible genes activator [Gammaproteobacteria bacterium]|nr:hydrogen peroxide-inducible genes activator [Gammaproteobacteria bacterium]
MINPPTLKQLKYFCTVADLKHFSQAAKACFVSQSTLSAGISELEQSLGVNLIDRSKKQVSLTAIGREVRARAVSILTETDDLMSVAESAHEPFTTEMRLGVIPTIAPFLLPKILKALRKRYPKFKLYIREDQSGNLLSDLNAGELDILLLALPYPAEGVTNQHLFYDELVLACNKGSEFSSAKKLTTHELKDTDLLLLEEGHCLRDHVLEACKLKNSDINVPYYATSLNTVIQMVANDIGISILPKMAVDAKILRGTTVETHAFIDKKVRRSIGLMWRSRSPRQAEFSQVGELISECMDIDKKKNAG